MSNFFWNSAHVRLEIFGKSRLGKDAGDVTGVPITPWHIPDPINSGRIRPKLFVEERGSNSSYRKLDSNLTGMGCSM